MEKNMEGRVVIKEMNRAVEKQEPLSLCLEHCGAWTRCVLINLPRLAI